MSNYAEINLEYGMPTVAEAINYLKTAIERYRHDKCKCLLIIHGYGSSGKGGAICEKARQWLMAQKRNGKLKNVIYGEDFTIFNETARNMKSRFHELEELTHVCNNGVTVIEL